MRLHAPPVVDFRLVARVVVDEAHLGHHADLEHPVAVAAADERAVRVAGGGAVGGERRARGAVGHCVGDHRAQFLRALPVDPLLALRHADLRQLRTHRGKLALDVDWFGAAEDHGRGAGAAVPSLVRSIATKEMREFESRSNSTPARCAESSTGAL